MAYLREGHPFNVSFVAFATRTNANKSLLFRRKDKGEKIKIVIYLNRA
jgi:hypothetical protein